MEACRCSAVRFFRRVDGAGVRPRRSGRPGPMNALNGQVVGRLQEHRSEAFLVDGKGAATAPVRRWWTSTQYGIRLAGPRLCPLQLHDGM